MARIRGMKFPTSSFREGYPITKVDNLFDNFVAAGLAERAMLPVIDSAPLPRKKFEQVFTQPTRQNADLGINHGSPDRRGSDRRGGDRV